jgi:hypothetical protein
LEDPGVNGRINLRSIFRKSYGGIDLIDLAQDRDTWRVLVYAVIIFAFHKTRGISSLPENRLASQEGLCSLD